MFAASLYDEVGTDFFLSLHPSQVYPFATREEPILITDDLSRQRFVGLGIKTWLIGRYQMVFRYRLPWLRWKFYGDSSQHGEYLFLRGLVEPPFPKFIVDVGANDGLRNSNSYPLLAMGWSGILVEPNPRVFARLQERYKSNDRVQPLHFACGRQPGKLPLFLGKDGEVGEYATLSTQENEYYRSTRTNHSVEVTVEKLTTLLQRSNCPSEFGILSVDTEGFDFEVLASLDFNQFRPLIVITEDENVDDESKFKLLRDHGYTLIRRFTRNSIWRFVAQRAAHFGQRQ